MNAIREGISVFARLRQIRNSCGSGITDYRMDLILRFLRERDLETDLRNHFFVFARKTKRVDLQILRVFGIDMQASLDSRFQEVFARAGVFRIVYHIEPVRRFHKDSAEISRYLVAQLSQFLIWI